VVAPSSYTVDSAIMDKGGNLDERFNAVLVDSSSFNAWPMSGNAPQPTVTATVAVTSFA
jgi:hypothetical protein